MTDLTPPNATEFERAIYNVIARVSDIPVQIDDLMNADRCPLHLLPWLAWGLGFPVWDSTWPESVKRDVCRNALELHRIRGTKQAIETALNLIGITPTITEWFDVEGSDIPGTFSVTAFVNDNLGRDGEPILSAERVAEADKLITAMKRGSQHHDLKLALGMTGEIALGTALRARTSSRLHAETEAKADINTDLSIATALRSLTSSRLHAETEAKAEIATEITVTSAMSSITISKIHMEARL